MKLQNPIKFFFSKEAEEGYVPNRDLLAHSVALTGQNMTYGFISGWWFTFCTDILKISPDTVGWITSLSRLWDAVNDPLIGSLMDKHRFKSGEKLRPYTLYTPPIIGIISALMFVAYATNIKLTIAIMMVLYFVWDILYSIQDVALWGMIAVSSPHSEERARVAQWVSIGAGAGGIFVGLFPNFLGDNFLNALNIETKTVYLFGGIILGLGGELISMLAYKQKERIRTINDKGDSIKEIFRALGHNKVLLTISLARFLQALSPGLDWIHFFESSISFDIGSKHIDGGNAQFIFGMLVGVPGAIAIFFATRFIKKLGGMKKLLIVSQIANIALRIISFFVGYKSLWQLAIVLILMSIGSIPGSMMDIAHRSLTSDSIDYIEWKTGVRNEGISFSVQNFISKMQGAVSFLIKGYILKFLSYDADLKKYNQNPTYMKWQWPTFILGPVVGSIFYLMAISFVDDNPERKAMVEAELKERREKSLQAI